ncbi:MAG: hypothetical protein HY811_10245 [Planctomycetes bacterium]|nr:hypothetical protein [Planctomycetota bacterium]
MVSELPEKNTQAEQTSAKPRRKRLWVLLSLLIITTLIVILLFTPTALERNEAAVLKQFQAFISSVLPFRCTSSSGTGQLDFWTADVAGYYAIRNGYIDIELAQADFAPLREAYSWVPPEKPIPKQGYYYMAITLDENGVPYRQDYDNDGKDYTNLNKFGFCAFPADYGKDGKMTFIGSYHLGFWRKDTGGKPVTRWPDEYSLATEWECGSYNENKWRKITPPVRESYPDGVWVIKVCVAAHHWTTENSYKDQLTFTETKMSSKVFASQGYAPTDYSNVKYRNETKWEAVQKNKNGDTSTWRGRASGSNYIYGTLIIKPANGNEDEFFFESIKTGPPIPKKASEANPNGGTEKK